MPKHPKKKTKKRRNTGARKLTASGLRGGGKFQKQRGIDRELKGAIRQTGIRPKKKKKKKNKKK